jgi:hypothetical protein
MFPPKLVLILFILAMPIGCAKEKKEKTEPTNPVKSIAAKTGNPGRKSETKKATSKTASAVSVTRETLKKIALGLEKRRLQFEKLFADRFARKFKRDFQPVNPADILYRKQEYRKLFYAGRSETISSAADSAEVLLSVLSGHDFGPAGKETEIRFEKHELADTDGDGKPELVDGWKRPFRYYLWPTRLLKPNGHDPAKPNGGVTREFASALFSNLPANDEDLNLDPDDPFAVIAKLDESRFHTFSTFHAPLVVSAGPDDKLGLLEPYARQDFGHLAKPTKDKAALKDNLTNQNINANGKSMPKNRERQIGVNGSFDGLKTKGPR